MRNRFFRADVLIAILCCLAVAPLESIVANVAALIVVYRITLYRWLLATGRKLSQPHTVIFSLINVATASVAWGALARLPKADGSSEVALLVGTAVLTIAVGAFMLSRMCSAAFAR